MKIQKIGLDEIYSLIKSEMGSLDYVGYDAYLDDVKIAANSTLLGWFFANISAIKSGCDLLVAYATGSNDYSADADTIRLKSSPTPLGLLIEVIVNKNYDNGCYDYSGRYRTWSETTSTVYLLNCK